MFVWHRTRYSDRARELALVEDTPHSSPEESVSTVPCEVTWMSLFHIPLSLSCLILALSLSVQCARSVGLTPTRLSPVCAFARSLVRFLFVFSLHIRSASSVLDGSQSITIGRAENTPFACENYKENCCFCFTLYISQLHASCEPLCVEAKLRRNKIDKLKLKEKKLKVHRAASRL